MDSVKLINIQMAAEHDSRLEVWIYDEHSGIERPALYSEVRALTDDPDKKVLMIGV